MVDSRLVSNDLIYSGGISGNIQLKTFFLLSNVSEPNIGAKTKNFDNHCQL